MAFAKVFVFAIAFLAVQAQAYPQTPVEGPIIDIISKLLPIIESLIHGMVNSIDGAIDKFNQDPEKFREDYLTESGKILDTVLDLVNQLLDQLKGKVDPVAGKIISCVEGSRADSEKVFLALLDNTSKCIVPELGDVLKLVKGLRPDLNKLIDELFNALNGIQKCKGDIWEETTCLLDVAKDLLDVIEKTSPEVVERVKGLVESIGEILNKEASSCILPNLQKTSEDVSVVITGISKCIAA